MPLSLLILGGALCIIGIILSVYQPTLMSIVPGHQGYCKAIWMNQNQVTRRLDRGISVFCRHIKRPWWLLFFPLGTGPEFHGMIYIDGVVEEYRQRSW